MFIGYISLNGRGRIDDALAQVVELLEADGLCIAGTVRARPVEPSSHPCDMDLRILPNGPLRRIGQPLGREAHGCRLDGAAIEDIALAVEERLGAADILVVNKFGKQESHGRGLSRAIAWACAADMPVLVGVNAFNLADFERFTGGLAVRLPQDPVHVVAAVRAAFGTIQSSRLGIRLELGAGHGEQA